MSAGSKFSHVLKEMVEFASKTAGETEIGTFGDTMFFGRLLVAPALKLKSLRCLATVYDRFEDECRPKKCSLSSLKSRETENGSFSVNSRKCK